MKTVRKIIATPSHIRPRLSRIQSKTSTLLDFVVGPIVKFKANIR